MFLLSKYSLSNSSLIWLRSRSLRVPKRVFDMSPTKLISPLLPLRLRPSNLLRMFSLAWSLLSRASTSFISRASLHLPLHASSAKINVFLRPSSLRPVFVVFTPMMSVHVSSYWCTLPMSSMYRLPVSVVVVKLAEVVCSSHSKKIKGIILQLVIIWY